MIASSRARSAEPRVTYVLPDSLGGVYRVAGNLLQNRPEDAMPHEAVLVRHRLIDIRCAAAELPVRRHVVFEHRLPLENLHTVLSRLADSIGYAGGALVANDWIELAMLCRHDVGRAVIQIVHGDYDYYYDLAVKHEAVIDAYVPVSDAIAEKLRARLPHRRETIFRIPFGVPIPPTVRRSHTGPLRLLFVGRLSEPKGICDLPQIDERLRESGSEVRWTVVGDGPGRRNVASWSESAPHVRWLGNRPNDEVLRLAAEHDVFVLPTRAEGFPVALLEAMASGLVPVVSRLPSGIPELVTSGRNGETPEVGDVNGFATAIQELDRERDRLESMSRAARQVVEERYDIRERAADYDRLYRRWKELRRPRPRVLPLPYGSRLDQPWLPNWVVRSVRKCIRRVRGRSLREGVVETT